jgi:O-antigen/teichoic acid export membrane protein
VLSAIGEGSNLLVLALGLFMARALGPVAFGDFGTAFAFVKLFQILPDFGMSYASTLDIARDRSLAGRLVGNLLGFQIALSLLTLALCMALAAGYSRALLWAIGILCLDLIMKAVKSTLRWLLKGVERFGVESASLLIERGTLLAVGVAVLSLGFGLSGIVLTFAAVRTLDTLGTLAYVRARVLPLRLQADLPLWRELFFKGLPFAYAGAMVTLFFQVDQIMLWKIRGAAEAGWYRAPVQVLEGLALVPRVIGYAFIPAMAVWHTTAPMSVTALYRRGVKYLLLVGLPIAVFGMLAAGPFMRLIAGAGYEDSAAAAQVLIPACVFMFLSNFAETTLACVDRWRAIVISSTLALVLNIGLNLVWIPQYGFVGASWATLATEAGYCALAVIALQRGGHSAPWLSLAWRPLIAAAAFGLVLALILPFGLIVGSAAASLTWLLAALLLGVWDRREWDALRGLLPGGERSMPPV